MSDLNIFLSERIFHTFFKTLLLSLRVTAGGTQSEYLMYNLKQFSEIKSDKRNL